MSFRETVDLYLDTIEDVSKERYRLHMSYFSDFVNTQDLKDDYSIIAFLSSMGIPEICESLSNCINNDVIRSKSYARQYISVIKGYFQNSYNAGIKNEFLLESFGLSRNDKRSYQNAMNKFIQADSRLSDLETMEELSEKEVDSLIRKCNKAINQFFTNGRGDTDYNEYVFSIIIKLIIFAGSKYEVIRKIEFDAWNTNSRTIRINNFTIHLPDKLSENLNQYLEVRKETDTRINIPHNYLFTKFDGSMLEKSTTTLANQINRYIKHTDVTGISKYSIIEMIREGINPSIIRSFTGVGKKIYNYCQKRVNEEMRNDRDTHLDSKLRRVSMYNRL